MSDAGAEGLVERLRHADQHSQQRCLGSRIFGEAADALEAQSRALAEARAEIERKTRDIEAKARILTRMAQNVTAAERQRDEALEALIECESYFDNRADADCDQDGFIPNKEMRLLTVVRGALAKIGSGRNLADAHSENTSPSSRGTGE